MHALVEHLPGQLERAAQLGYPLAFFACDPCEKLHHVQVRLMFGKTALNGGKGVRKARLTLYNARRSALNAAVRRLVDPPPRRPRPTPALDGTGHDRCISTAGERLTSLRLVPS